MYYDGIRTSQRSIQFHFLEAGNDPAVRQILRETRNRLVLEIDNLKTEVEHGESKLLSLIERVDQLDAILTEQANDLEDIHRKITYLKTQVSNILTRIAEIVDLYHRQ
ncbi:MAG: hypothetical protein R2845_08710 [Thermomicrobiales bacterium]